MNTDDTIVVTLENPPLRFRYSLRSLMLLVTACAVLFAVLRYVGADDIIYLVFVFAKPMMILGCPIMIVGFAGLHARRPVYNAIPFVFAATGSILVLFPQIAITIVLICGIVMSLLDAVQ